MTGFNVQVTIKYIRLLINFGLKKKVNFMTKMTFVYTDVLKSNENNGIACIIHDGFLI